MLLPYPRSTLLRLASCSSASNGAAITSPTSLSCRGLPGPAAECLVQWRSRERVEVVAHRFQTDAHEYLAQLGLCESTSEKIVDRVRGDTTTHAHDGAREAHERVDPRIRYRFAVADSPNDRVRRAKHPRNGRMCR